MDDYKPVAEIPLDLLSELMELRGRFNAVQDYLNKDDFVEINTILAILGIDTTAWEEKQKNVHESIRSTLNELEEV